MQYRSESPGFGAGQNLSTPTKQAFLPIANNFRAKNKTVFNGPKMPAQANDPESPVFFRKTHESYAGLLQEADIQSLLIRHHL